MRHFEFRAWDKDTKQMYIVRELMWLNKGLKSTNGDSIDGFNEIMEFTGTIDKNGIKIFEGDYVLFHLKGKTPYKVKFGRYPDINGTAHCGFYAESMNPPPNTVEINSLDGSNDIGEIEVVGNIYTNLSTKMSIF